MKNLYIQTTKNKSEPKENDHMSESYVFVCEARVRELKIKKTQENSMKKLVYFCAKLIFFIDKTMRLDVQQFD